MTQEKREQFDRIAPLIGRTPLLEIHYRFRGEARRLFAKMESYNLTGNIKDRVAFHILRKAYERGTIQPGDRIIEATSGNTGIAFSALGRYLGHDVIIYMPDWMSMERIRLMESYGAEVRLVSREEGGFLGSIAMTEELARGGGVFLPGGTVMGIGRRLRQVNPACKVFPLEPANSPTLSTGYKVGSHRIQGISDEFIPSIVKLEELDEVISVEDGDALRMARMLSEQLGLGVGVSSGANFVGGVMAQNALGGDTVVVTTFADDNKKYLSTDYAKEEPMKDGYLCAQVELTGVIVHPCAGR